MSGKARILIRSKAARRRRFLLMAMIVLVASPVVAWFAAHVLIVKAEMPSADAIVVLSGSATYIERANWAAKLYREGRAPLIVLTDDGLIGGWDNREDRNPHYYEMTARRLQQQGVPADRIQLAPGIALGTYEESLLVRDYATARNLKRVLVVTSGYHSRRALWSMRRACEGSGIQVGMDSAPPGWQTPSPWLWWSRRWGWKVVAGEYLKMVYYWTKY
ncbi:MAG TPA: YdcF family protein [Pyrinomonadaceae bacterium]|nr:YdcF family protein [Pyrinomonadaceae bacterium]